ncbi:hypothetical protein Q73_02210 [Bacillus coahuilensis m2-6]|uniref:FtsW/RodA/SpoVE family cell cycle protein n=1 Tax=Bacillus coahuilensis TaxID=408580 RepID=UPI000750116E|nr:FtsW/RodA/SpoVE family cell cycle protein [Bacillus coahuilensis]KUP09624.1 hypothetical protein Q73_02210 [Bacillus coahuilensis m2-6]
MNERKFEYLDRVTSYIKSKEAKRYVEEELHYHLQQEIARLTLDGYSREEAEQKAIEQMGSPDRLGAKLNKLHRPRFDWVLALMVFVISLIGILPLLEIRSDFNIFVVFLPNKIVSLVISLVIILLFMWFPYQKLVKFKWLFFILSIVMMWLILEYGVMIKGAPYFIIKGGVVLSSFSVLTILFIAWLSYLGDSEANLLWVFILFVVSVYFFVMVPALSATLMYVTIVGILLWVRFPERRRTFVMMVGSFIVVFSTYVFINIDNIERYQLERLLAFINPENYKDNAGYNYLNNKELLSKSGWFGQEGGQIDLVEFHTDFAFVNLTYHYGWLLGGFTILLGMLIAARMLRKLSNIQDPFGRLIILGEVSLYSFQFLYNIMLVFGVVPYIAISLPFISYGLTSTVQYSMIIGLFLSVFRRQNLVRITEDRGASK